MEILMYVALWALGIVVTWFITYMLVGGAPRDENERFWMWVCFWVNFIAWPVFYIPIAIITIWKISDGLDISKETK